MTEIEKALEHCVEWKCDNCPNRDDLGSGETVCRGRLLPQVLEYVADLDAKLAEKEKQYQDAVNQTLTLGRVKGLISLELLKNDLDDFGYYSETPDIKNLIDRYIEKLKEDNTTLEELHNQDKISFCIEQLEKVKEIIARHTQELWTCENDDIDVVLYEEIDNQIKQLKEGK